jgi:hypothetical protein
LNLDASRHLNFPQGKTKKFAEVYVATNNLMKAYKESGLAPRENDRKTYYEANYVLKRPVVQNYVRYLGQEQIKKMAIDIQWVVDRFERVYDAAMAEKDFPSANKALESLGKYLGMFIERTVNTSFNFNTEAELDAELKKLIHIANDIQGQGEASLTIESEASPTSPD